MPHFFFDTSDGDARTCDRDGLDLPSIRAARAEAVALLPALARDMLMAGFVEGVLLGGDHRALGCTVRDGSGQVLLAASLVLQVQWSD